MFNTQLVAFMVYINNNLSFVWFIYVLVQCWISHSWFLDCFSKLFQAQSVAVPDLLVSNSFFYFWVYIACDCSEIHSRAPASATVSEPDLPHAAVSHPNLGIDHSCSSSSAHKHHSSRWRSSHCIRKPLWFMSQFYSLVFFHHSFFFFSSIANWLCHFFTCSNTNNSPHPHLISKPSVIGINSHSYIWRNFSTFFSIKCCYISE